MIHPFNAPNVLWAAGWWDLAWILFFGAIYFGKFVLDAIKQQQERQAQQQGQRQMPQIERAKQPPPMPQQPAAGGQPQRAKTPAEEVEEFLRRAASRKAGGGNQPAPRAQPKPPPSAPKKPPRRVASQQPSPRPHTVEPELVEASEGPSLSGPRPTGSGVAKHVQTHLDESEFTERAEHLSHLKQTSGSLAEHVQHTFEHRVGTLAVEQSGGATAAETEQTASSVARRRAGQTPTATELAALLRRPDDVRTAIILNELMRRPEERW